MSVKQIEDELLENVSGGSVPSDYVCGDSPKFAVGDKVEKGSWGPYGYIIKVDYTPKKYSRGDRCKTYIYHCDLWDDDGWSYSNVEVPEYLLRHYDF